MSLAEQRPAGHFGDAACRAQPLTGARDSMCGFFAIRRDFLLRFGQNVAGFKIVFEILVRGRKILRVREIPIVFRDRAHGQSKMSFGEAARFAGHWLRAVTKRIFAPARAPLPLPAQELSRD